jgi:outer membrane protein OmpA-like peptidoglycan-associated protein
MTKYSMRKILVSFICSLALFTASAQNDQMRIEGTILSISHKRPLKDELIIFRSTKSFIKYEAFSGEDGKFSTQLPVGDRYRVYIMGAQDSAASSVISIPEKINSSNPFLLQLQFEPVKVFILRDVNFEFDKAELTADSYKALGDLTSYLERKATLKVEIGGHTDNIGRESKNRELSTARAKAVADYLFSKGIPKKRLSAQGYGSREPIADNSTESGREQNRRIEVKILNL